MGSLVQAEAVIDATKSSMIDLDKETIVSEQEQGKVFEKHQPIVPTKVPEPI